MASKEEVVETVINLWDAEGGWIPGAAFAALAEALEVDPERLLVARRKRWEAGDVSQNT